MKDPVIDEENLNLGFVLHGATVLLEDEEIHIYRKHRLVERYSVEAFKRRPNAVFRRIQKGLA